LFLLRGMLAAVNFDGEPQARAIEVECKWADRMLSSEVEAIELIAA
jgi:hypothetical protein